MQHWVVPLVAVEQDQIPGNVQLQEVLLVPVPTGGVVVKPGIR
jgi:hypothetical protein